MTRTALADPADDDDQVTGGDDQATPGTALVPRGQWTALAELPGVEPDELPTRYVARIMEMLPPPSADAIEKIAAGILGAPSPGEENQLWEATGSRDLVGRCFIWHRVTAQPSDYQDAPLPYFLACEVTDKATGERTIVTTGSVNICTSLVKAQLLGNLPWEAEIVGPRRTPKSGHIPLHLRWLARVVQPADQSESA